MPNIKSQKDRVHQTKKETARNKSVRTNLRSTIKKSMYAIEHGGEVDLSKTVSVIDKAVTKGVMHKKTAARRVSRLAKMANAAAVK